MTTFIELLRRKDKVTLKSIKYDYYSFLKKFPDRN